MKARFIYATVVLLGVSTVLISFSINQENKKIEFSVPQGWPSPTYNFSKYPVTKAGLELGRTLFYDTLLSKDFSISCASCHFPTSGFTHGDHSLSHGINGQKGKRNSLTIFNVAWNKSFMWDGSVKQLEEQPLVPITSPIEMDNTMENIVAELNKYPEYKYDFARAFGDTVITSKRILNALAQFTVSLVSSNSKYDKYMRKEPGGELTDRELKGLEIFRKNCASCHTEPLFTNNSFENNELPVDSELLDLGRISVTRKRSDLFKFKVPSLRNIANSAPYMHDGRFTTLGQVIEHYKNLDPNGELYKKVNIGIYFSLTDQANLILFLHTLTDREFLNNPEYQGYSKNPPHGH